MFSLITLEKMLAHQHLSDIEYAGRIVRQTSLTAYYKLKQKELNGIPKQIVQCLKQHPNSTDYELTRRLGYHDPNKVRPRRRNLVKEKIIEQSGKRPCQITNEIATTWKLKA